MLPLCSDCTTNHLSKSGFHYILPLSIREQVTSARDLTRLQHKVQQLNFTHQELQQVLETFQRAREDIEATYQEVVDLMTATKEMYVAKLRQTEEAYSSRMEDVIQRLLANAWRAKEYRPDEPFAELIWSHIPGEDSNFDLTYKVEAETHLAASLFKVKWQLPFPGFSSFQGEARESPQLALPILSPAKGLQVPLSPKAYPIFVHLPIGTTIRLDVQSTDTLQMLREKVATVCSIPLGQQTFIFKKKQLEDGKTLGQHGVEREATVTLVMVG